MQYEFLKNFPKRMKNVGLYGVLIQNSIQKTSWKQFGFLKFDEQMNLIFAVMLYIMEQSLAPFAFRGLSCQLRRTAHGRFVKARPARPTSTHLGSCRACQSPSGGSIVAQTKRDTVPRGVPARCRTGRLEEPWHAQPNAPRPRTTRAATNG